MTKYKLHIQFHSLMLLLLTLVFVTRQSLAQDVSELGRFTVENATGCVPLSVSVTEIVPLGTSRQYWYENKDSAPVLSTSFTYNTAGEYYLVQLNNNSDGLSKQDSIKITVFDPTPPEFLVHNCNGHRIRVEITDTAYDSYRVDFTATDSETVGPGLTTSEFDYGIAGNYNVVVTGLYNNAADNCSSENKNFTSIMAITEPVINAIEVNNESSNGSALVTYTIGENSTYYLESSENDAIGFDQEMEVVDTRVNITGINTLNSYHCYRLRTFDACNNAFIYSDTLCSVSIDVEVDNGSNKVTWNTEPGLASAHKILRDGAELAEITDPLISSYDDSDILCGNEYCYEIQSIYNSGTSLSIDSCVVADKTGDLDSLFTSASTITNENVVVTWPAPENQIQISQYVVQRSVAGRGFHTVFNTFDNTFTDEIQSFRQSLRYQVLYQDNCGNKSIPSPITEPMILNITSTNGSTAVLEWNKYENWPNGVRTYFVERLDDSGTLLEEYGVLSGRTKAITFASDDNQAKNLRVRAESLDSPPQISYSNIRTVVINPLVNFPTAFTPDGDDLNDEFLPIGGKVFNFEMLIFSRWGEVIFSSDNMLSGWDGKIRGKDAPEGTYIYRINFEDATGKTFDQSGAVYLLRKE